MDGSSCVQEKENPGDDLLDNLDSYMEDLNDRLTISRMVSDSFIKGMVNAVSQEAAEVVAAKEIEVDGLKKALQLFLARNQDDHNLQMHGMHFCFADSSVETDSFIESLHFLSQSAKEQLERLEKYVVLDQEGHCYPQLISAPDIDDGAYNSLKATLEAMSQQVHGTAYVGRQLDLKIREEVEAKVFSTIFQSIQEDYERRLWDVNSVLNLVDRFKEISILRLELDSIHKDLAAAPEHVHLSSQGKMLSSHVSPSGSLWDGDRKCEESKISMPENLETSKLSHMTREELYLYFRNEITKMKRDHESAVQLVTEENFTLKRDFLKVNELLKERGDKDFEMLRKNISEAILKLDDILAGSEKLSEFCNHSRDTLDGLLSENYRLKGVLNDKNLELRYLSSQASDATKKLSQHSAGEDNLHKLTEHLKSRLDDAEIEASISEEVYKCTLRDVALQIKLKCEDLDVNSVIMQDIIKVIYQEAVSDAGVSIRSDSGEFSDLNSTLLQQIYEVLFQQVSRDMSVELAELKKKCLEKDESLAILDSRALKNEKELQMVIEENKMLKEKVSMLENSIEERKKLLDEVTAALEEKKQQFEVTDEECRNLRTKYGAIISDRNKLVLLENKLVYCQKQIDLYESEVAKLNEKLELSESKSRKAGEELAKSIWELEQIYLALLEAKDGEHSKSMELLVYVVQELSKSLANFELSAKESICLFDARMEISAYQLKSLISKVNRLRRTGLLYKERLEKRCSDLQKAEAEVDLLGDEVDALQSLLEKVYVALDHYSPILQHYPGIMEILKLVGRELSGEAVKAVGPAA